jgi:hypothetical protein
MKAIIKVEIIIKRFSEKEERNKEEDKILKAIEKEKTD